MQPDTELELAAGYLRMAGRIVVFTGAGVSAESGIETFRDDGGFWTEFAPETFATWGGLIRIALREPRRCAAFLLKLLGPVANARPNEAHAAIARMEEHADVIVVTQNVDRLHQEAGSTTVREIHGSLFEVVTLRRRFVRLLSRGQMQRVVRRVDAATRRWRALLRLLLGVRPLAGLSLRGIVRPSAVLFGEPLAEPDWTNALADARACDVMLVVGTSGMVLPAAMLPSEARAAGAKIIAVNPSPSPEADIWIQGTACEIIPKLVTRAFGTGH